ncbi:MAG TPA: peptidoglycan-binding domain-containing protein [Terriglobales bacterium]|nr:peptidoglycan-binding domain-containing protein [Terriglobales bacterium]
MVSHLSFMIFLAFLSAGCSLLTANEEAEKAPLEATPAQVTEKPTAKAEPTVETHSVTIERRDEGQNLKKIEAKSLAPEDVRRLQAKLKASGFDPGPVDGILGPKTKSAFLSLQSGCSGLMGLAALAAAEDPQPNTVTKLAALLEQRSPKAFTKEEIQQVQARLKQSGFEPGPLDGILGPRTHAALLRAKAGCSLAEQFPRVGVSSIAGTQPAPIFDPQQETKPATSTFISAVSFDRGGTPVPADPPEGMNDVRALQIRLKIAGFDPGPLDGIFGPRTMSALQRYRAVNGARNVAAGSMGSGARMEY